MSSAAIPPLRRPGRPRSERARRAILAATADLLAGVGLRGMSMDAVAERAGVSKATIYRWWTSKADLALDALREALLTGEQPLPDTGSLQSDLTIYVRTLVRLAAATPAGPALAALVSEAHEDPALLERYREHVLEPIRRQVRLLFARAVARGEIRRNAAVEVALDMVYGAVSLRLLLGHARLDRRFADALVRIVLAGTADREQPGTSDPTPTAGRRRGA